MSGSLGFKYSILRQGNTLNLHFEQTDQETKEVTTDDRTISDVNSVEDITKVIKLVYRMEMAHRYANNQKALK